MTPTPQNALYVACVNLIASVNTIRRSVNAAVVGARELDALCEQTRRAADSVSEINEADALPVTPEPDLKEEDEWRIDTSPCDETVRKWEVRTDTQLIVCGLHHDQAGSIVQKHRALVTPLLARIKEVERQIEMDSECIERIRNHSMSFELALKKLVKAFKLAREHDKFGWLEDHEIAQAEETLEEQQHQDLGEKEAASDSVKSPTQNALGPECVLIGCQPGAHQPHCTEWQHDR